MSEDLDKKIKLVTHDGFFHADDIYATATLILAFGKNIEIIRSRKQEIIDSGDIVFDVGSVYDPSKNKFDHHQTEGAGTRENGAPYASFGLIWKHFAQKIVDNQKVIDLIDGGLVQNIDVIDSAFDKYVSAKTNSDAYVPDTLVSIFYPTYKEDSSPESLSKIFIKVVDLAVEHLKREIEVAKARVESYEIVEKIYQESENKDIIILDEPYNWKKILMEKEDVFFVVFPFKNDGRWGVQAIQKSKTSFENKKDLPKEWGGLRDEELQTASGVKTAVFCHRTLYLAAAREKEDAIKLAELALKN